MAKKLMTINKRNKLPKNYEVEVTLPCGRKTTKINGGKLLKK